MSFDMSDREMIEDVTRMGVRAAVLLKGVMLKKVDHQTLEWGLEQLAASDMMRKYFQRLLDHPEYVHLLNVLHIVNSLEGQLDYQVREYGLDSLKDDLEEINFSLNRIGEDLDIQNLSQPF